LKITLKLRSLLIAALLSVCLNAAVVLAQGPNLRPQTSDPLTALPTSDVVAFANVQRILTEIVPRVMMKDPATLLKMTTALNDLYQKTGVNLLSIDRVAGGLQFIGSPKLDMSKGNLGIAIIIHGEFDADKFIAFLKQETKNKGREESYGGKTIHIEPPPTAPKQKPERETGALAFLDDRTLVVGDLPQVRATIDAASGKGRVDSSLVQLATRDSNSLIGLAGNVPPELIKEVQSSAGNDQMGQALGKLLSGLKQVFASFGATPSEFDVMTGARMSSPEQAASISDLLLGIRQQAVAGVDVQEMRDLINAVQITAQGDEVQIKANISNSDVQQFVALTMKKEGPKGRVEPAASPVVATTGPAEVRTAAKPAATTKHRRKKRRQKH
jgi:hypothetical protein